MNYNNSSIRRRDRQLDEPSARRLLKEAEYGILCMQALHGGGYGVPLHFVWDEADAIYLHCAPEGRKLECLAAEPRACLVITGKKHILPKAFSTAYESLLLHGEVSPVTGAEEKHATLRAFLQKYTPESGERGEHFLQHTAARTVVLRFRIISASGKTNKG